MVWISTANLERKNIKYMAQVLKRQQEVKWSWILCSRILNWIKGVVTLGQDPTQLKLDPGLVVHTFNTWQQVCRSMSSRSIYRARSGTAKCRLWMSWKEEASYYVIEQVCVCGGGHVPAPASSRTWQLQPCVSGFIVKRRRRPLGQLMLISWS